MGASSAGNRRTLAPAHFLWRSLGAVVLGVMLAKWSWLLLAPHATAVAVAPEQAVAVEAGRLFGATASGVSPVEGIALSNVRLVGVFAARIGQPGFAVLELDGKRQAGVALGDNVTPGIKLSEVAADHVVLERAGMRQRVNLEGQAAAIASAKAAVVPVVPPPSQAVEPIPAPVTAAPVQPEAGAAVPAWDEMRQRMMRRSGGL